MGNAFSFTSMWADSCQASMNYWGAMWNYADEFLQTSLEALEPLMEMETKKAFTDPQGQMKDLDDLLSLNMELALDACGGAMKSAMEYHGKKLGELCTAAANTCWGLPGEKLDGYWKRLAEGLRKLRYDYPRAIREIEKEFGFDLDNGGYELAYSTPRFDLYRVKSLSTTRVDNSRKPIIIIPPYVLGEHVLAFLPRKGRSYAHCFSNLGIPTYVRIVKDINKHPAVQQMSMEDDILDTAEMASWVKNKHARKPTISGLCQGGTGAFLAFLSGRLDGVSDRLVTVVSPIDGTKSQAFREYIDKLPAGCRDLGYALSDSGNGSRAKVINGFVLSAVYKWIRFGDENPISNFFQDLSFIESTGKIPESAAAVKHWMTLDRRHLPHKLTEVVWQMYLRPIREDGTLPVRLFGEELNIKRFNQMALRDGFRYYLAFAPADKLVEMGSACAPLGFLEEGVAEAVAYSKGHIGVVTSHTDMRKKTDCPLDECFPDNLTGKEQRGIVRAHLDWDAEDQKLHKGDGLNDAA